MAVNRHDDSDGSDIFWPGYVDATTNLILNLLFLLTILIVAVFMFALELGRSTQVEAAGKDVEVTGKPDVSIAHGLDIETEASGAAGTGFAQELIKLAAVDPVQENIELKQEVKRLQGLLAEKTALIENNGGLVKTVQASSELPEPGVGLDNTVSDNAEVLVHFKDESIAFLPEERDQLIASLQPILASGQAVITVDVPAGFSEAKRIGYYRAMAVRNLLIEMDLPGEKIDVTVLEKSSDANAALVRVK